MNQAWPLQKPELFLLSVVVFLGLFSILWDIFYVPKLLWGEIITINTLKCFNTEQSIDYYTLFKGITIVTIYCTPVMIIL